MARELIVRVTIKDCDVQTFHAGGPGGQNQNVRDTAVRIVHAPSGAVGVSREHRTQLQNKKAAWRRMGESAEFHAWVHKVAYPHAEHHEKELPVERIRTYNLIDHYVKDHRLNKQTRQVEKVLDGDLDRLLD